MPGIWEMKASVQKKRECGWCFLEATTGGWNYYREDKSHLKVGDSWNGPTRADLSVLILPKKYVYQLNQNFIFSADVEGATDVT